MKRSSRLQLQNTVVSRYTNLMGISTSYLIKILDALLFFRY